MTCNDCRFFKPAEAGLSSAGLCRKSPPQLFVMQQPASKLVGNNAQSMGFMSQFPPTFPDSWCGAWEAK